jgi:hypothetical protein
MVIDAIAFTYAIGMVIVGMLGVGVVGYALNRRR